MKAEMRIKDNMRKEQEKETTNRKRREKRSGRELTAYMRGGMCAALLFLLAIGGYAGAKPEAIQMAAAPVVLSAEAERQIEGMSFEEIEKRHESGRRTEIEMLDGIIEDERTDETTRNEALAQKLQLINRMDTELAVTTTLAHMGFERTAVLLGAGQVSVIVSQESLEDEDDTLRIIDAAASLTGVEAKDVKIILVKK